MQRLNLHSKSTTRGPKILYDTCWYKNEAFFKTETPKPAWKLVSKNVIPGSTGINYVEQTQVIVDSLRGLSTIHSDYEDAFLEWDSQKEEIEGLVATNWQEAARSLEALKVNQNVSPNTN